MANLTSKTETPYLDWLRRIQREGGYAAVTSAEAGHILREVDSLRAAAETNGDDARRTAEYWKAEHLAGNKQIDRLRAALREAREYVLDYGSEKSMAPVVARIDDALSNTAETGAPPLCDGEVRVIYQHGEPTGVRDSTGFLCHFNHVLKWEGQEERYRRELAVRAQQAEVIANALRSAVKTKERRPHVDERVPGCQCAGCEVI